MRRNVLFMLPFLAIALSLWGGMHYYVFARLARDPALPAALQALVAVVLGLGALSIVPAFARALPKPYAGWVHVGAFGWLGGLFIFDVLLVAGDAIRWIFLRSAHAATGVGDNVLAASRVQAEVTAVLGFAVVGYAIWNARRDPAVTNVSIFPAKWPKALDGLRIVQLSDVHVSPDTDPAQTQRLVDQVNALQPDIVALTGDLVDGSTRMLEEGIAPLSGLQARLGVYFVTGNHEYYSNADAWIAKFRGMGFRLLQNERVTVTDHGASFELAGVPDWTGGQFGMQHRPRLADTLAGRDPAVPVILLAHQPKQFPEAVQQGVSLQLSGHTHGGQIWPFTLLVALAEKHVAGLARIGESQIYVSRGTRYWGPPMRIGAPHELTHITLKAAP